MTAEPNPCPLCGALPLIDDLRKRAKELRKCIANSQRIVDLLKPEMDRFDASDAPWSTYVVRMSVDHSSSIRSTTKEASELECAADTLAKLAEYASHRDDCQIMTHGVWSDPIPCTCGLADLLREIGHG